MLTDDLDEEEKPVRAPPTNNIPDPALFIDNLKDESESRHLDYDRLRRISSADNPPDCFVWQFGGNKDIARREYKAWLGMAVTAKVPMRLDMPGEPNYCNDCTAQFKASACRANACRFPNTLFEVTRHMGEKETVGVSRSLQVDPKAYYIYRDMMLTFDELPLFIRERMKPA